MTEHRPPGVKAADAACRQAVRDPGARDTGGVFGPQRERVAGAVGEAVHLFGDDIGRLTERARKKRRELEDGGGDRIEPPVFGKTFEQPHDMEEAPCFLADQIARAAYRLEPGHPQECLPVASVTGVRTLSPGQLAHRTAYVEKEDRSPGIRCG